MIKTSTAGDLSTDGVSTSTGCGPAAGENGPTAAAAAAAVVCQTPLRSSVSGGLSPMAQATIDKHLRGGSKRVLLAQAMNKESQSRDAGTITGKYI